jgi:putative Mg2+ transporter-C (MgtC) family protein
MQAFHEFFASPDWASFATDTVKKLVLAAVLGGLVGLEREIRGKAAGLRTNMFICFGAAMFTLLSFRYSPGTADHNRISAQIITGIGFIGAGSILHSRGAVSGLTTAATIFVVASIGMAVGGEEYLAAIFATLVLLAALIILGWVERYFHFKSMLMGYAVTGSDREKLLATVSNVLTERGQSMHSVQLGGAEGAARVFFTVEASKAEHSRLVEILRDRAALERVEIVRGAESE